MKRHCDIKQILRTKLAGVTIFAAFTCIRAFADSDIDLLRKICEEQKKHARWLENYSYTVNCQGQQELESVQLPIRTDKQITLLNGNARMSQSHYIARRGGTFVMNKYCREEVLLNEEMFLVWPDRDENGLNLYYRADYKDSSLDSLVNRHFLYDPRKLGYQLDSNETLCEVLDQYISDPDKSGCTWKIEKVFDVGQRPTLFILSRTTDDEERPDTIIKVDPTKNYVVTETIFQPGDEPDNYCRKTTSTFQFIANQWLVTRYDFLETSDYYRNPVMDLSVTFSDLRPTPPEAAEEMTVSALKLPNNTGVYVAVPNERGIAVLREDRLERIDGQFVPARGTFSSKPRYNPFPNAPKTKTDELIDWVIENLIYLIP